MNHWLNTFTGKRFKFLNPKVDDIDIVDIAHALSNQCRYAGHTREHYSIAEHCVILSRASSPGNAAWALMHDAAEAYITDIPYPIKAAGLVPGIVDAEKQIMRVICERFGLDPVEPAEVKELDLEILDLEAGAFLVRHPDWPKGTPRQPRDGLVFAWQKYRTPLFKPGVSFMMRAMSLGLAAHEDVSGSGRPRRCLWVWPPTKT